MTSIAHSICYLFVGLLENKSHQQVQEWAKATREGQPPCCTTPEEGKAYTSQGYGRASGTADPEKLVHVCQELSSYSSKWRKRYNLSCSPGDPAGRVQKAAARQFLDKGANGPNFCGQTTADSEEPLVSEKDHGGVPLPVWPRWGK